MALSRVYSKMAPHRNIAASSCAVPQPLVRCFHNTAWGDTGSRTIEHSVRARCLPSPPKREQHLCLDALYPGRTACALKKVLSREK